MEIMFVMTSEVHLYLQCKGMHINFNIIWHDIYYVAKSKQG